MARPPKLPVAEKEQIVLAVLRGDISIKEAARRSGISETSVGTWKDQFIQGGREGLGRGQKKTASSREQQLEEENRELVQALGELHVRLRASERGENTALAFR